MCAIIGLRSPRRLAAIVALSGYLPLGARTLQTESNAANQRLPIFLAHGEQDEVVVIDRARAARTASAASSMRWSARNTSTSMSGEIRITPPNRSSVR
mgnify:CR=1 FL=1